MSNLIVSNKEGTLTRKIKSTDNSLSHIIVVGTQAHRGDAKINAPWNYLREVGEGSKLMFVHQALRTMNLNREISYEFLICKAGYTENQLNVIQKTVETVYNGTFIKMKHIIDIISYINTGDIHSSENLSYMKVAPRRLAKPIKQLFFYAHGLVGELALGLGLSTKVGYTIGINQVKFFQKESFTNDAEIYCYACRIGLGNTEMGDSIYINEKGSKTDPSNKHDLMIDQSLAQKLANQTKATVYAYINRSDYSETLFTNDELCFKDYYEAREKKATSVNNKLCNDTYKYLLNQKYTPTETEKKRWEEWKKIEFNKIKIDGAWFDPDGARHPVKGGTTPVGVPNDMKTFKPQL